MMRFHLLFGVSLILGMTTACEREDAPPIIVHVLRDPSASFAKSLRQTDFQFGLTKPRLKSGKWVMVATNEGNSYPTLVRRLADTQQDLLILNSPSDLPDTPAVRGHVGKPQFVCGGTPAYIPDWISGESREAAEMYLKYLAAHCEGRKSP
jgi:hypothetical protein